MGCRIGMSHDVPSRERAWGHQAVILANGLTYDEATEMEARERTACGHMCQGREGGPRLPGRIYSVYRMDW